MSELTLYLQLLDFLFKTFQVRILFLNIVMFITNFELYLVDLQEHFFDLLVAILKFCFQIILKVFQQGVFLFEFSSYLQSFFLQLLTITLFVFK